MIFVRILNVRSSSSTALHRTAVRHRRFAELARSLLASSSRGHADSLADRHHRVAGTADPVACGGAVREET